jgi:hypothetical protein
LLFIRQPHVGVTKARRPGNLVDAFDALQKRRDALETVCQFSRHQFKVDAATLLEVSELRNLEPVEHHLPTHTPRTQGRRFPVVLFKLDVVLRKIDPDRLERSQILVDHIGRRGLENHL